MTNSPLLQAIAQRAQRWLNETPSAAAPAPAASPAHVRNAVIDAMQRHDCDHYTRRPGIAPLCRAIVNRLAAKDVAVDPEDGVVVTGGVAETRFVAVRALAANQPLYLLTRHPERYQVAAEFAGATVQLLDPGAELPTANGGLLLVEVDGQQPDSLLARLAHWVETSNLNVIADEIDVDLLSEASAVRPFASLPDMAERTLTLGSFAQLPTNRVWQTAWFAGAKKLSTKVRNLKQAMTICSPAPGQYAALASMQGDAQ